MNVGEMLSYCTTGAQSIGQRVDGGGVPIYPCSDIMAALGMVKCPPWMICLIRHKYMGETDGRDRLTYWVMSELTKISVERGWLTWDKRPGRPPNAANAIDGEKPLTKLANLAIAEYLLGDQCPTCNGQKQIGPVICHNCEGTGLPIMNDAKRGEAAGFHPVRWLNVWSAKYPYAQAIVRNADELVLGEMRKRLRLEEVA